jgi:menaquinone-dependent protoporphyrinogen oxidase
LAEAGHDVDAQPAGEIEGLEDWDAAVVGAGLYAHRWQRSAGRFVHRHEDELQRMPVWFFSSGPLDDSAQKGDLAPTAQVRHLMERVHARGHVTFGGRLEPDATGFVAHAMAKNGHAGDWRDLEAAQAWGHTLGMELASGETHRGAAVHAGGPGRRAARRALGALCLFTGLTAVWGGLELMLSPGGFPVGPPLSLLAHSPFSSFFLPGLLLAAVVGLGNLLAAGAVLRRHRWREPLAFGAGACLAGYLATEMAMLRLVNGLQLLYLAIGLLTMALALWLWGQHRSALDRSWTFSSMRPAAP